LKFLLFRAKTDKEVKTFKARERRLGRESIISIREGKGSSLRGGFAIS